MGDLACSMEQKSLEWKTGSGIEEGDNDWLAVIN